MTARAQQTLINEVRKQPRVTDKHLNKQGVYGRTPCMKLLLTKKNIAECRSLPKSTLTLHSSIGKNVFWTDETKNELFGKNTQHYIWCKKRSLYIIVKTLS
uniref:Transposase Tc1-like domain-containing protein n=1 Tax=Anabas testudineus TaxID=64144 RepID=A0A3Q1JMK7_ANATE